MLILTTDSCVFLPDKATTVADDHSFLPATSNVPSTTLYIVFVWLP